MYSVHEAKPYVKAVSTHRLVELTDMLNENNKDGKKRITRLIKIATMGHGHVKWFKQVILFNS